MSRRHAILRLEAPLLAFGAEMVDARGPVRPFPAASMLTGLIANALGWRRWQPARHQRLQARLIFAAVIDQAARPLRDFQTAQLGAGDVGWTTRGRVEKRGGGANTYKSPHIRYRDFWADARVAVALRLDPADEDDQPDLDDVARALDRPARPLFIGRKPCLPAVPIFAGFVAAPDVLDALVAWLARDDAGAHVGRRRRESPDWRIALPGPAAEEAGDRLARAEEIWLTDERDWHSGVHAGRRRVVVGNYVRPVEPSAEQGDAP